MAGLGKVGVWIVGAMVLFLSAGCGHTTRTNLSQTLGIGRLAANPVVANLGNDTGAMNAIAIVVQKADANNELWTVEHKAGEWSTKPVLRADGSTARSVGANVVVTAFGPPSGVYDRSLISAQGENDQHFIYARQSWRVSYRELASTNTTAIKGPLSIAHWNLYDGDPTCYPRGCAMYRDATTDKLMYAGLASGGNLTNQFRAWEDEHPDAAAEPYHWARLGGAINVSPDRNYYIHALARASTNNVMKFTWSSGSSVICSGAGLTSAQPMMVMNTYYEALILDMDGNLKHWDFFGCQSNKTLTDLGLKPLAF